jgi:uncharacterized protein
VFLGRAGGVPAVKLRVDDITADIKELDFVETETEVNRLLAQGPIHEYRVEGPFSVRLSYYRSGMELFFAGLLKAEVTATCARCAEDFSVVSNRDFRFVLAPRSVGNLNGKDLSVEDLEFSLYDGEEVDVSPLVREQLLLALPTRPLCQEGCRGLCPQCGANLNLESCGCSAEKLDPRLEALRSLKISRP